MVIRIGKGTLFAIAGVVILAAFVTVLVLGRGKAESSEYVEYVSRWNDKVATGMEDTGVFEEEEAKSRAADLCAWFDKPDVVDFPMNYTPSFPLQEQVVPLVQGYCPRNAVTAQVIFDMRMYGYGR
jgi:hypothetical protein